MTVKHSIFDTVSDVVANAVAESDAVANASTESPTRSATLTSTLHPTPGHDGEDSLLGNYCGVTAAVEMPTLSHHGSDVAVRSILALYGVSRVHRRVRHAFAVPTRTQADSGAELNGASNKAPTMRPTKPPANRRMTEQSMLR